MYDPFGSMQLLLFTRGTALPRAREKSNKTLARKPATARAVEPARPARQARIVPGRKPTARVRPAAAFSITTWASQEPSVF